MKKALKIMMVLAFAASIASNVTAKSERSNKLKKRLVEEHLTTLGEKHFPAKMKVKWVASIEIGETYYHIYQGELEDTGYHVIVYDNYENYLGYYKSDYPPTNYEIEGAIALDSGDVDDNSDPLYYKIPIDPEKGLPMKLQIGNIPTSFVKSPSYDEVVKGKSAEETTEDKATDKTEKAEEEKVVPEFRTWTIDLKGKPVEARAIFVKLERGKVYLRLEATGQENGFEIHRLSRADQEYVKQFE